MTDYDSIVFDRLRSKDGKKIITGFMRTKSGTRAILDTIARHPNCITGHLYQEMYRKMINSIEDRIYTISKEVATSVVESSFRKEGVLLKHDLNNTIASHQATLNTNMKTHQATMQGISDNAKKNLESSLLTVHDQKFKQFQGSCDAHIDKLLSSEGHNVIYNRRLELMAENFDAWKLGKAEDIVKMQHENQVQGGHIAKLQQDNISLQNQINNLNSGSSTQSFLNFMFLVGGVAATIAMIKPR